MKGRDRHLRDDKHFTDAIDFKNIFHGCVDFIADTDFTDIDDSVIAATSSEMPTSCRNCVERRRRRGRRRRRRRGGRRRGRRRRGRRRGKSGKEVS